MEQKYKRVDRHLYRRQFKNSRGEWHTYFYAAFVDWKGKKRTFPLGSDLKTARGELSVLEVRNKEREDFDKKETEGMTFTKWVGRYLELVKNKKSWDRDKQYCDHLREFFGNMLLSEIGITKIMEYKNLRLESPIIRHNKPVEGRKVSPSTVNREMSCLRRMTRLAAKEGLIEKVPTFEFESEKHLARERVASDQEYADLLKNSPRWLQRVSIGAYETAISQGDLLKLTWDEVDQEPDTIVLRGGREKTGVKQTAWISLALREVLNELREEQKKVPNLENRVFTHDGRPITKDSLRKAFDKAKKAAGIRDFKFHDFRHTAKTRWAKMGIPVEIAMKAAGHTTLAMHHRYVNLQPKDIRETFEKFMGILGKKGHTSLKSITC